MEVRIERKYYEQGSAGILPVRKGDLKEVRGSIDRFCCDAMRDAWKEDALIGFGDGSTRDDKVNIYEHKWGCCYEHEITFCPFCGEVIEYVEGGDDNEKWCDSTKRAKGDAVDNDADVS